MAEIVICAAQSVTRAGLAAMVTMPTTEVVGQLDSLASLSDWIQIQRADLIVISTESTEALLQFVDLLSAEDDTSVLALLRTENTVEVEQQILTQLMSTALVSLLPVDVSANGLRSAIASILSGFNVLHPDITEALFSSSTSAFSPVDADELETLTPREVEVLNQLASGVTNRAIAQTLGISEHTVKFHISAILAKLDASSRTEAVAVGIRNGLVML